MQLFSRDTKASALARLPLFEDLGRKELDELARLTDDLEVPAGKTLCREGELGRELFVIVEGEVEVTQGGQSIAVLGPGEMVGEIALVEHSRRTATVTATTPVRCFVMTSQSFWSLLDRNPNVERKVLKTLAKRVLEDRRRA